MDYRQYKDCLMQLSCIFSQSENLQLDLKTQQKEYKKLIQAIESYTIKMSYPNIETELNKEVAEFEDHSKASSLIPSIKSTLDLIVNIEREYPSHKERYDILAKLPNRHNAQTVANRMDLTLRSIPYLYINDLQDLLHKEFPEQIRLSDKVLEDFEEEARKVKVNNQDAESIKKRLLTHESHVHRHNLANICKRGIASLDRIQKSPNYEDLSDDAQKIKKISKELDKCEASYRQDLVEIETEIRKMKPHLMWEEQWNEIKKQLQIARHDIFSQKMLAADFIQAYQNYISKKETDIDNLLAGYPMIYKTQLTKDISIIKDQLVSCKKLTNLKVELDSLWQHHEEEVKQLASDLKKRVDTHSKSCDLFNLGKFCKDSSQVLDQILTHPNRQNLNSEKQRIVEMERTLTQIETQFQIDFSRALNLHKKHHKGDYFKVWRDDWLSLTGKIEESERNYYQNHIGFQEYEQIFQSYIDRKHVDMLGIKNKLNYFTTKIMEEYILKIEYVSIYREDFKKLIDEMIELEKSINNSVLLFISLVISLVLCFRITFFIYVGIPIFLFFSSKLIEIYEKYNKIKKNEYFKQ